MKTKPNVTLYICQHCRKPYQVKHACERHEPICIKNPEYKSACGGCTFCQEVEKEYYFDAYDGEHTKVTKGFLCTKLNQKMYPPKVVRKGILDNYPESFEGEVCMPKECEHFEFTW